MPDLQLDVDVFLNQHLVDCNCPRSFSRRKINARAALNHWLPIRCPTPRPQLHSAHSQLIVSYDHHMAEVAGLAPATRHYRRRHALAFLEWTDQHLVKIPQLSANLLSDYITTVASSKTTVSVGVITTSLASLVKFLASRGDCSVSWIPALQRPAKLHALPRTRALDEDELSRLLGAFDRSIAIGKRDYAIARCLIDLGIRASDIAKLNLDQIDWRNGRIKLSPGKSKRERTLPTPATTTRALIDYVRYARPITQDRHVFVYHRAPFGRGISVTTVRGSVRAAFHRAGFSESASQVHRLRHTMATRLLRSGNSVKTIADVLGHLSINTTIRYTHVDRPMLAAVAMPWPGRALK